MSDEQTTTTPASERVREGYDTLPGLEMAVDYDLAGNPAFKQIEGRPYFDLAVNVEVRLPDGTTFEFRESSEREAPDDYDFGQAFRMLTEAYKTLSDRLNR